MSTVIDSPTLTSFELPDDDVPDFAAETPFPATGDKAPLRCTAEGCTNTVEWSGKGRKPKFCEEHKPRRAASQNTGRGAWPKAGEVETLLNGYVTIAGAGLQYTVAFGADGEALMATGPAIVHEVVELARNDKKLRNILEKMATPGRYGPLAMAVFPLVLAVLVNHNLLPASLVGTLTGAQPRGGE